MSREDERLMRKAKRRVEFKDHLVVYIIVNAFLLLINLLTVPQFLWVLFPVVFWGIGVFFHWREAYHGDEDERVEREYRRLRAEAEAMGQGRMRPGPAKPRAGRKQAGRKPGKRTYGTKKLHWQPRAALTRF
jgi:hypothetical protein